MFALVNIAKTRTRYTFRGILTPIFEYLSLKVLPEYVPRYNSMFFTKSDVFLPPLKGYKKNRKSIFLGSIKMKDPDLFDFFLLQNELYNMTFKIYIIDI